MGTAEETGILGQEEAGRGESLHAPHFTPSRTAEELHKRRRQHLVEQMELVRKKATRVERLLTDITAEIEKSRQSYQTVQYHLRGRENKNRRWYERLALPEGWAGRLARLRSKIT